jgi:ribosomal protein S18 acetylase RimI-like enzyme
VSNSHDVQVRPLAADDDARLGEYWRPTVEGHRAGRWDLLTAWDGVELVGSGCLRWEGPFNAEMAAIRGRTPELAFLQIDEGYRGAGIGTRLVRLAEQLCLTRGLQCLGLAVGVDNHRAQALYERLGYHDVGVKQVDRYVDVHGQRRTEVARYLERLLAGPV